MLGDEKDSNNTPVEGSALASKGGENGYRGEQRTRRRVCCDHCNKLGHTKDKCWLLHENLPIGGLDRVMEGAFKLQQMQEQPLKGKNPQPLKYHLAKEQMDMSYKLLNQSQQPNTNVRSCNLAQTSNLIAALSVTKKFKSTLNHRFRCFGKEMLGYLRTKLGIQRIFGTPFISLLLFGLFVPRFLRAFPLTYYN